MVVFMVYDEGTPESSRLTHHQLEGQIGTEVVFIYR